MAIVVDGEPHFVGADVCAALGFTNDSKAMGDHYKGVTIRYPLQTTGEQLGSHLSAATWRMGYQTATIAHVLGYSDAFEMTKRLDPRQQQTGGQAVQEMGHVRGHSLRSQDRQLRLAWALHAAGQAA